MEGGGDALGSSQPPNDGLWAAVLDMPDCGMWDKSLRWPIDTCRRRGPSSSEGQLSFLQGRPRYLSGKSVQLHAQDAGRPGRSPEGIGYSVFAKRRNML